jgi:hypothetical protein
VPPVASASPLAPLQPLVAPGAGAIVLVVIAGLALRMRRRNR